MPGNFESKSIPFCEPIAKLISVDQRTRFSPFPIRNFGKNGVFESQPRKRWRPEIRLN